MTKKNNTKIRTGFNNTGTIDLEHFERLPKIQFKDAEFVRFEWLDLSTVDTDSETFWNIGIRSGNDLESRVESFQVSFRKEGFLTSEFPPCLDTDNEILDGRGRITGAVRNKESYIPVAIYSRTDNSARNGVTNGLRGNIRHPQYIAQFNDFVDGGVDLIWKGELEPNAKAVDLLLLNDVEIGNRYDNAINGMITKVRNAILKRANTDDSLVWSRDKKQCQEWLKEHLGLSKSDYVLVNMADNETYAERAWRSVRKALKNGDQPVTIVYYTTDPSPSESRIALKKSMQHLNTLYKDSWAVVNALLPEGVTLSPPKEKPYVFRGAMPQIMQDEKHIESREDGELIAVDEF